MNAYTHLDSLGPDQMSADMRGDVRQADVERQIVHMLAEREKHSLLPNIIAWLACIALSLGFANPLAFAAPLVMRIASILTTRLAAERLRARLREGRPIEQALMQVGLAMCLGGVAWGSLVWPLASVDQPSAVTIAYAGVILAGACLITSLLGCLPRLMAAFIASFSVTALGGLAWADRLQDGYFVAGLVLMMAAAGSFALGAAKHHRKLAEAMIDNRLLSEELADALGHAEFLSQRDPLTGLFNRRAFLECQRERERDDHLLAIDLDHFKRINDIYGHDIGDRVLVRVAEAIRAVLMDLPGEHRAVRMGGEEFAIELDVAETPAAEIVADAIRKRIALATLLQEPRGLSATASIGVSRRGRDEAFDSAYRRADQALLEAKRGGRDRVVAQAA